MKQIITESQNDIYPLTVEEYETIEVIDDDVFILIANEEVEVE
jgi:hypothetical protein|tara:strand:+ start:65 stop:193 length:129 start_codon:yes stop_codon:yes gene_type:complete